MEYPAFCDFYFAYANQNRVEEDYNDSYKRLVQMYRDHFKQQKYQSVYAQLIGPPHKVIVPAVSLDVQTNTFFTKNGGAVAG